MVSKRKAGSGQRNPACAAVTREAGEELGEMTRRKREIEIVGVRNGRYFPHVVELALPLGPFGRVFLEIDAFHRERRIPVRRGQNRYEVKQVSIFDSASQTPPLQMHSAIASVASA
jgi:hypothetical protein